ncbi:hypothetical protein [Streptomyces prasinopilosus]|uniref:Uncharacterized protein n=1 Tax=Streptomyces prasinopilosus TaxID=67344 RepID=A0A1G6M299_9ACTN|nr:hypothetical protein [Streptomyces prasinopilosus]SDC49424.1 hypothetical protein SAMN05216505_102347 [Streptomyces prasinopilosus]
MPPPALDRPLPLVRRTIASVLVDGNLMPDRAAADEALDTLFLTEYAR